MSKSKKSGDDDLNLPEWDEDEIKKMLEGLNTEINLEGLTTEVDLSFLTEMHDDSALKDLMEEFNNDSTLKDLLADMNNDANLKDFLAGMSNDTDLKSLMDEFNNISINGSDEEIIPDPDPNLTEQDVAQWMLKQVHDKGSLYQIRAAFYIRRHFGDRFVYGNKNSNLAISKEVLEAFLYISFSSVVWVKKGRYWRLRKPTDDPKTREAHD